MIEKTKDYDIFKFALFNRRIEAAHLEKLIASIKDRNLLHLRPILVNENMEVIDGQNRLMAAKRLDLEIYYEVRKDIKDSDVILLNVSKTWKSQDYLNYYLQKQHPEYIKLKDFIVKNDITINIALILLSGNKRSVRETFRQGKYIHDDELYGDEVFDICRQTLAYVTKMCGHNTYLKSNKFWNCLVILVTHAEFDAKRWFSNLGKLISKMGPRVSRKDYLNMLMYVYNWRTPTKIDLIDSAEE